MSASFDVPIQRSRGMRDLLPPDMRAFRRVEDAFRGAAARWGYEEVRTPTIETYSLFTAAGGLTPAMLSRVYTFLDWDGWSGDRVVLRPDSTIPVARLATEAAMGLPARMCYVQNVFRFSAAGDREDWQIGIEYLGAPGALADLEVAAVACETLDALGMRPVVRLGHVGVTRALAASLAAGGADFAEMVDAVTEHGIRALRPGLASDPQLCAFVDVAVTPGGVALIDNLRALADGVLPDAIPALDELRSIATALAASRRDVVVDFGIPRDFEYYTGVVFEFDADGQSWGKGGRYAPGLAGPAKTACGLALDAGRLADHLAPSSTPRLTVAVVPGALADMGEALQVAQTLHRSGISAALASDPGAAAVAVRVRDGKLSATTPDTGRDLDSLDDLVGLLVQYK
ncbi:MAG: ATP phosphoribosyltransferase regulatory subunit [Dehalococcoidia bacterium]|nr:ATP phosphoribosyltransferase regulatory subunit [Dehalococcoidia bacterium]